MDLKKIENEVQEYLSKKNYQLYSVKYYKKDSTLEILLDNQLEMDEIEKISNDLSNFLDQFENEFDDNYVLDVSTVGVERPIRNEEEMKKAIGQYLYIKTKENEYYGTLKTFENNICELEVKDKTRIKTVSVDYKDIKKVHYAVKF